MGEKQILEEYQMSSERNEREREDLRRPRSEWQLKRQAAWQMADELNYRHANKLLNKMTNKKTLSKNILIDEVDEEVNDPRDQDDDSLDWSIA
jgi:hypothetical protein